MRSFFLRSSAIILVITGLLKLASITSEALFLTYSDPILTFLTNRQSLTIAFLGEMVVACVIIFKKHDQLQVWMIGILSSIFLSYRLSFYIFGVKGQCSCLGFLGDWLNLSPVTVNYTGFALLLYLLAGSYYFIFSNKQDGTPQNRPLTVS
jgi:hypothetical protein